MKESNVIFHPALRLLTRMEFRGAFRSLLNALKTPSGILGALVVGFYFVFFVSTSDIKTFHNMSEATIADFAGYLLLLSSTIALTGGLNKTPGLFPKGDVDLILPGPFLSRDLVLRQLIRDMIFVVPLSFLASVSLGNKFPLVCGRMCILVLLAMAVLASRYVWGAVFRQASLSVKRVINSLTGILILLFAGLGIAGALPQRWGLGDPVTALSCFRLGMAPFRSLYFWSMSENWHTTSCVILGLLILNGILFERIVRGAGIAIEIPESGAIR